MASSSQKAFFLERKGGVFYEGTRPVPKPGPGDLLVKIQAFALNPADWKVQGVDFHLIKAYPTVVGADAAGDVEEVGEGVSGWEKGDRLCFEGIYGNDDRTAFQQYALVPAQFAIKIPTKLSYEEASTLPVAYTTAAMGLLAPAPIGAGLVNEDFEPLSDYSSSSALVIGGAASVGQLAIQLLKYLGFKKIFTYASGHHTSYLKSLGATDIIDRKTVSIDQLPDAISKLTAGTGGGAPIKVVYNAVGSQETHDAGDKCLPDGQGQSIVTVLGRVETNFGRDSGKKLFAPVGIIQVPQYKDTGKAYCARLEAWLKEGVIQPLPVDTLPHGLQAIQGGLERLKNQQVSGVKLVGRPY